MGHHYSMAHLNPDTMDDVYDRDEHEAWLLALSDLELLEYAIYRLPPHVLKALAGAIRAYYSSPGSDEHLTGALEDSREMFEDDRRTAREL